MMFFPTGKLAKPSSKQSIGFQLRLRDPAAPRKEASSGTRSLQPPTEKQRAGSLESVGEKRQFIKT